MLALGECGQCFFPFSLELLNAVVSVIIVFCIAQSHSTRYCASNRLLHQHPLRFIGLCSLPMQSEADTSFSFSRSVSVGTGTLHSQRSQTRQVEKPSSSSTRSLAPLPNSCIKLPLLQSTPVRILRRSLPRSHLDIGRLHVFLRFRSANLLVGLGVGLLAVARAV